MSIGANQMGDNREHNSEIDAWSRNGKLIPWKKIALVLMLYDIIVANFSYLSALIIRFELHFSQIKEEFLNPFLKFAPVFTIISILVFYLFHLYNSLWKYAGFNELIRILEACIVTSIIQLLGTVLFVKRMPISYYVIGSALQLLLTVLSRFSYRIFLALKNLYNLRGKESCNVMVVGFGPTAQLIIRDLLSSPDKLQNPVCIITEQSYSWGRTVEGIPVVGGKDSIKEAVSKYDVKTIVFADPSLPIHIRTEVLNTCEETGCDIQNFSGFAQLDTQELSVKKLMNKVKGPVILSFNGMEQSFASSDEALNSLTNKYVIREISSKDGSIRLALSKDIVTPSDLSKQWAEKYIKDSGELPSYF